jgi:hypothetical protein
MIVRSSKFKLDTHRAQRVQFKQHLKSDSSQDRILNSYQALNSSYGVPSYPLRSSQPAGHSVVSQPMEK